MIGLVGTSNFPRCPSEQSTESAQLGILDSGKAKGDSGSRLFVVLCFDCPVPIARYDCAGRGAQDCLITKSGSTVIR